MTSDTRLTAIAEYLRGNAYYIEDAIAQDPSAAEGFAEHILRLATAADALDVERLTEALDGALGDTVQDRPERWPSRPHPYDRILAAAILARLASSEPREDAPRANADPRAIKNHDDSCGWAYGNLGYKCYCEPREDALRDAAREVVRFYGTDRTWSLMFRQLLGSRIDDLAAALASPEPREGSVMLDDDYDIGENGAIIGGPQPEPREDHEPV
ncbi:MAG TPA: hypothetical protein VFW03_09150 [Gemmatimonadaceae bacterium]|nr:hypothetical protein [Gemmatimonadaceae bacterium]